MSNLVEKISTVTTTAIFNQKNSERFLIKMEWNHRKKSAVIIMTAPSSADDLIMDQTTMLCRNGAVKNGFGSLAIVNLTSSIYGDNQKHQSRIKKLFYKSARKQIVF